MGCWTERPSLQCVPHVSTCSTHFPAACKSHGTMSFVNGASATSYTIASDHNAMAWPTSLTPQDCEFTYLSVQILHLLGEEGPTTKDPGE